MKRQKVEGENQDFGWISSSVDLQTAPMRLIFSGITVPMSSIDYERFGAIQCFYCASDRFLVLGGSPLPPQRNVKGQVTFHWDLSLDSVDFEESGLQYRNLQEIVLQG